MLNLCSEGINDNYHYILFFILYLSYKYKNKGSDVESVYPYCVSGLELGLINQCDPILSLHWHNLYFWEVAGHSDFAQVVTWYFIDGLSAFETVYPHCAWILKSADCKVFWGWLGLNDNKISDHLGNIYDISLLYSEFPCDLNLWQSIDMTGNGCKIVAHLGVPDHRDIAAW
jgi:hypothetical protein